MNLKHFRDLTKNFNGDTEIVVCDGIDTFELYDRMQTYPPVLEHSALISFDMGQQVDKEHELDIREPT